MTDDPIVAEVRRAREEHARRFGFDVRRIYEDLKASERARDRQTSPLVEAPSKDSTPPALYKARFAHH